jgi:cob(I)alamin adenosyltransferase
LPAGGRAAAALHLARTVTRRAERLMSALAAEDQTHVGRPALVYLNRLSDLLFVASRFINANEEGDVLWVPGKNR